MVTVSYEKFRKMQELIWYHIDDVDLDQLWFQQNGTTVT